eukprot:TRINITY_DN4944_c0_g1_i5.p1 TRINITY_DN4944_c0_g1~~TRINITY_DN4944_c0_g1_i5.p1  ORF type:complete len:167 (-),score=11.64 TRINITY_DN4944_c0_g1_i5:28-507(-)
MSTYRLGDGPGGTWRVWMAFSKDKVRWGLCNQYEWTKDPLYGDIRLRYISTSVPDESARYELLLRGGVRWAPYVYSSIGEKPRVPGVCFYRITVEYTLADDEDGYTYEYTGEVPQQSFAEETPRDNGIIQRIVWGKDKLDGVNLHHDADVHIASQRAKG